MQNNFNHNINELSNFSIEPAPHNWAEIEKNLPTEKKRRIVAWWWSLPSVLVFMGVVFWMRDVKKVASPNTAEQTNMQQTDPAVSNAISPNESIIAKNSQKTKNNALTNTDVAIKPLNTSKNTAVSVQKNRTPVLNNRTPVLNNRTPVLNNGTPILNNRTPALNNGTPVLNNGTPVLNNRTPALNSAILDKSKSSRLEQGVNSKNLPKHNRYLGNIKPTNYPSGVTIKNTANTQLPNTSNKNKKTSKLSWQFTVGAGANYLSNHNVFDLGSNSNNSYTPPTSGTGIGTIPQPAATNKQLPLAQTGWQANVGVLANYRASKTISLQLGLAINHMQNNTAVDPISQLALFNWASDSVYTSGNSSSYKNSFTLLQLPINFMYCFNPIATTKLSWVGGATVEFALHKKWLYSNNKTLNYEVNNTDFNNIFLSLQTGISLNFNNKLSLMLLAKKYVTPVQKTSAKYYWQQLGLQVSVPF